MRRRRPASTADRDRKLGLLLHQLDIAADALRESAHWVRELDLRTEQNLRRIGQVLSAVHQGRDVIFQERPDLAPPESPRVWAEGPPKYQRSDALHRLHEELWFVHDILRDAAVRVEMLDLRQQEGNYTLERALKTIASLKNSVSRQIEGRKRRRMTRSSTPEPEGRDEMLERLEQDLQLAVRILGEDCAGLFRELNLRSRKNIRAIGGSLVGIFDIQEQIYAERPDLIPEFLREAYRRK